MADINIQQKSSNMIWWILGIVALVIVAWFLFASMGDDTQRYGTIERHHVPLTAAATAGAVAAPSLTCPEPSAAPARAELDA